MKYWKNIKPGIIADFEIKKLCPSELITKGYDPGSVKQTCYELRVGETVWYTYLKNSKLRKTSVKDKGGVYLPPKAYATIITMEELELPTDCVGRIMTKGQLFSIGISAVNTYADPGFSGHLGITLINHSKTRGRLVCLIYYIRQSDVWIILFIRKKKYITSDPQHIHIKIYSMIH